MSNTGTPSYLPYDDYAQSANALFHFMKKKEYLVTALMNRALVPRYCIETVDYLDLHGNGYSFKEVAILQKCFCDIPFHKLGENFSIELVDKDDENLTDEEKAEFEKSNTHPDYYGKFGIVFSKKWGEKNNLQPVHYVNSGSNQIKLFSNLFQQFYNADDLSEECVQDTLNRISYFKPLRGIMKRTSEASGRAIQIYKNFYDECEWRYVPDASIMSLLQINSIIANPNQIELYLGINKGMEEEKYRSIWLPFSFNDIKYIIVPEDNGRIEIINTIMNMPNSNFEQQDDVLMQKYILISKILVLNEIRKDW